MSVQVFTGGAWKTVGDTFPAGTIVMHGKIIASQSDAPAGWLWCNGDAVSRTTYADLFAMISTNFGSGDGSTTFTLPDMRGFAPVGVGTSVNSTDADGIVHVAETYILSQKKNDVMQGHKHNFSDASGISGSPGIQRANTNSNTYPTNNQVQDPIADASHGTPRTGYFTHGKRIGLNFIIKT